jgi:predicted DCC family thiol-disulfide oxidoreductase YuxK
LSATNRLNHAHEAWQIRVLFDGECPLCGREIRMLERLDRGRGCVDFEDISKPAFDPAAYGLDAEQLMARIHGVLPDGSIVEGLEVFRRVYAAVGLGWLMAPTRWPLLRDVSEAGYRIFAQNRLRWTGREAECDTGRCQLATNPSDTQSQGAQP